MNVPRSQSVESSISPSLAHPLSEGQEKSCSWYKTYKKAVSIFSQLSSHTMQLPVHVTAFLSKVLSSLSQLVEKIIKKHFLEMDTASIDGSLPSEDFINFVVEHNCEGIKGFSLPLPDEKTSFSSQLFRGRMPAHLEIPEVRQAHRHYLEIHAIKKVVLLQENEKVLAFYRSCGIEVETLFIPDLYVPNPEVLLQSCQTLIQHLQDQQDQNVLVHCQAGLGRTGLYLCALYQILSPHDNAMDLIRAVREQHPEAVETWEQFEFLQTHFCDPFAEV